MPRAQLGAGAKRKRADAAAAAATGDSDPRRAAGLPSPPPRKRARHTKQHDLLSPLSDELLVRVLSLLSLGDLLGLASVSRRFHVLSADSQLWKSLYYARFVLPRALRIPGFRDGSAREGKLHYASRRTVWADGRRGGWVDSVGAGGRGYPQHSHRRHSAGAAAAAEGGGGHGHGQAGRGDWKRQYKLRHNWSLGKCAVEELNIKTDIPGVADGRLPHEHDSSGARQNGKTLVKVSEGVAVTADVTTGLRAWDLKTKLLLAQTGLLDASSAGAAAPTCMALDDHGLSEKLLDVAVGFADGSFGLWRVDLAQRAIVRRYRHEQSSNGGLVGLAYSHPYLLTATKSVLVSLYTFDVPSVAAMNQSKPQPPATACRTAGPVGSDSETERESAVESHTEDEYESHDPRSRRFVGSGSDSPSQHGQQQSRLKTPAPGGVLLPAPYLMTSLKSHTSRDPLALSIRKSAGSTTVASIAYTFSTIQGWSLGIQDLHIRPPLPAYGANGGSSSSRAATGPSPEVVTTRLAYTLPVRTAPRRRRRSRSVSGLAARRAARDANFPVDGALENTLGARRLVREEEDSSSSDSRGREGETSLLHSDPSRAPNDDDDDDDDEAEEEEEGPTSICYTHPYLLATLPDNTLILHLCTSTSTSLSISPVGIRLWGHTSGISDAEITARGKAVSVSSRGDEIRVWELEGGKVVAAAADAGRANGRSSLASQQQTQDGGGGVGPAGLGGTSRRVVDAGGSSSGGGGGGNNEGSSVAVRPIPKAVAVQQAEKEEEKVDAEQDRHGGGLAAPGSGGLDEQWDDRRNWVGFDDEMVIVLKESRDGRESLLVYDFT
ncbi:F-box and WD-40 domain protein 7 [Microdochium nivale]|nr:F-box and WD-40 domain protein 7 [Microdochium nivale]